MAKMTFRNVDEETRRGLRLLAALHGRSMEAEVVDILRKAARDAPLPPDFACIDSNAGIAGIAGTPEVSLERG